MRHFNIKKFPRLEKTKNQRGQTFFTESDRNRTLQFVQGSKISGSQKQPNGAKAKIKLGNVSSYGCGRGYIL